MTHGRMGEGRGSNCSHTLNIQRFTVLRQSVMRILYMASCLLKLLEVVALTCRVEQSRAVCFRSPRCVQVQEVAMAVMCNLTHDVCCELDVLETTGALQYIFSGVRLDIRAGRPLRPEKLSVRLNDCFEVHLPIVGSNVFELVLGVW